MFREALSCVGMIEIIFSHCDYINFYFIAVLKHHDEGNHRGKGSSVLMILKGESLMVGEA